VGLPPPTSPGQAPGRERQGGRVGGEVHQLHTALHDPCPGGAEPVVDHLEHVGVEQVLGVGHAHPGEGDLELVQHLHGGVEADRLVVDLGLLRVRAHQDLAGVLARLVVGDRGRARVIGMVDDRHHPVVRVIEPRQPLQRLARDRLLVPHRDQDHPGETGRIRLTVAVRVVVLRPPPLVELERQRRRGDQDHEDRDDQDEDVGEEHRQEPGQRRAQDQRQRAPGAVGAGRMAWTHARSPGERPVLVRAEVHHATDDQQAPVGDRRAGQRGQQREQADADEQAHAPGEMESAPPLPEADPGAGDTAAPREAAVGDEVELQGGDRLERVRDPSGTSKRDEDLQQPVAEERDGTPDQREQPLLAAPQ
jgi:hypothetical protein